MIPATLVWRSFLVSSRRFSIQCFLFVLAATPERFTPKQHNVPHIVGKFSSVSCMSLAPPRRVLDGETAEVFVTNVTVIECSVQCKGS